MGGPIMYLLLFFNIMGIAIIIYKFITIHHVKKSLLPISSLFEGERGNLKELDEQLALEYVQKQNDHRYAFLESGLDALKIIATISPLLGLLGTVLGVLTTFQDVSVVGLGDPREFAEGISLALITTVGGLVVAIPHQIAHHYFTGVVDKFYDKMDLDGLNFIKELKVRAS